MTHLPMVNDASTALCTRDRMQLFAHGENLLSLTSRSGLTDCLDSLREWLDLSEIVVATGTLGRLTEARLVGSGYDAEWMRLYMKRRFVLVDPIVCAIVNGHRFVHRDASTHEHKALTPRVHNGPTREQFLEAARDYGRLGYGFASGVVFNDRIALCSVITAPGRGNDRAPMLMRALRPMLYQALMRILLPEPVFPSLSQREIAILECLPRGLGDPQIADAMSISAYTVRFHLAHVLETLRYPTR